MVPLVSLELSQTNKGLSTVWTYPGLLVMLSLAMLGKVFGRNIDTTLFTNLNFLSPSPSWANFIIINIHAFN